MSLSQEIFFSNINQQIPKYIFHELVYLTFKLDYLIYTIDSSSKQKCDVVMYFLCRKIQKYLQYYLLNREIKMRADYETEIPSWINDIDKFIVQPTKFIPVKDKKLLYNCQRSIMTNLNYLIRNACLIQKIENDDNYFSRESVNSFYELQLKEALRI